MKKLIALLLFLGTTTLFAQIDFDAELIDGLECTTITVGKKASVDGSVITSHSDDSNRGRTNIMVTPAANHSDTDKFVLSVRKWAKDEPGKMPRYKQVETGRIPQVAHTFQYLNTAYPCLNEKQLAIGESTIGGHSELKSDSGLVECQQLCRLMLERCSTARQAIKMADDILKRYGWNDAGEVLTIADKNEVWHMEIYGPGKDRVGAVWVAQRVPDDHVAVNANASTIHEIDLKNKDYFMASDNIYSLAEEFGWYDRKKDKTFDFAYVYAPESRAKIACRRREWRVFDLLAPSLKLDPNSENYPFSVKPDTLVSIEDLMKVFKDYYEGTEYDMRKYITITDKEGKTVISPMASPFMKGAELQMHKVNGGWNRNGERSIAVHYTVYCTILQLRSNMPDEVGALCWFALDNAASSMWTPIYANATDLPIRYKTDGRETGFSKDAAWWGFNRLGNLTNQRWGDFHKIVDKAFDPIQKEYLDNQSNIESQALDLIKNGQRDQAIELLTRYTNDCANRAVDKAWEIGDMIWTKYDGAW